MTIIISRLYDSYAQAAEAVRNLENAGVPRSDISIISNNSDDWYSPNTTMTTTGRATTFGPDSDQVDNAAEGAGAGAGLGATAGGVVGLLTGLGLLAIPGVDPWLLPDGWLRQRPGLRLVAPPVALSGRSLKLGPARKMPTSTRKVCAVAAP